MGSYYYVSPSVDREGGTYWFASVRSVCPCPRLYEHICVSTQPQPAATTRGWDFPAVCYRADRGGSPCKHETLTQCWANTGLRR